MAAVCYVVWWKIKKMNGTYFLYRKKEGRLGMYYPVKKFIEINTVWYILKWFERWRWKVIFDWGDKGKLNERGGILVALKENRIWKGRNRWGIRERNGLNKDIQVEWCALGNDRWNLDVICCSRRSLKVVNRGSMPEVIS